MLANDRSGSIASACADAGHFRYSPMNRRRQIAPACLKRARSRSLGFVNRPHRSALISFILGRHGATCGRHLGFLRSNMIAARITTFILVSFLCASCVGAGVVTGLPIVWDAKDPGTMALCPSSNDRAIVNCLRKPFRNAPTVEEISPSKLIEMWGRPKSDDIVNGIRNIVYDRSRAWRGIVIFVILPIPLLIPLGHNEARFSFENDHLVHVEYTDNWLTAAVCGLHSEGPNGFGCIADWH